MLEDLKVEGRGNCQMAPWLCGAIGMTRFGQEKKVEMIGGEKVLAGAL